jgi:hypothetical protein
MPFQIKLIVVTLSILIFAQLFSSLLSLSSFEKIYSASLISVHEVAGKSLQQNIEASLRLGKPLTGLGRKESDWILRVLELSPEVSRIRIVAPDGGVLYPREPKNVSIALPHSLDPSAQGPRDSVITVLMGNDYAAFFPLHDRDGVLVGYVNLEFSRQAVHSKLGNMARENLRAFALITALAVLVLILAMSRLIARPLGSAIASMYGLVRDPSTDAPPPDRPAHGQDMPALTAQVPGEAMTEAPDQTADRSHNTLIKGKPDELTRLRLGLDKLSAACHTRLRQEAHLKTKCSALREDFERFEALEQGLERARLSEPGDISALLDGQREVRARLERLLTGLEQPCAAAERHSRIPPR